MELNRFKIYYDVQPDEVVDKISSILKPFGIIIKWVGDGDSYFEYQITKIDGELGYDWVTIIDEDYDTYPKEGYTVLVSDGTFYDVAYYVMSSSYVWMKSNIEEDDSNLFTSFVPTKWKYLTNK